MTYSAQQGGVEISRLHKLAICKEIGERLAVDMKPKAAGIPPHLMTLIRRIRDKFKGNDSIVVGRNVTLEEMAQHCWGRERRCPDAMTFAPARSIGRRPLPSSAASTSAPLPGLRTSAPLERLDSLGDGARHQSVEQTLGGLPKI